MIKEKRIKRDPLANMFVRLRPTEDELAKVKAAERDPQKFVQVLGKLDRKYKVRSLETLGVDKKLINPQASRAATKEITPTLQRTIMPSGFGVIGQLVTSNQLACDCLVPFSFRGLDVYNSMSGPEMYEVTRGIIGANRYGDNEYSVWNPGDTTGKTRVHLFGQMHISFSADLPQAGRWCLFHPSGFLDIHGHSRVVGHGNSTTSYDAKVWIDYFQVLEVGGTLIEISGGEIHYDGTRSEDRTKYFDADRYLPPRYLFFNVPRAGDTLLLTLRIEVDTAANEDGLALGVIDQFGFPAVLSHDYDTFVIKAP